MFACYLNFFFSISPFTSLFLPFYEVKIAIVVKIVGFIIIFQLNKVIKFGG